MRDGHDTSEAIVRAVSIGGGALFLISLGAFSAAYLHFFSVQPDPPPTSTLRPVLIDTALFSVFALHHSLFARTGLKAFITTLVPARLERSVYVWIASALFLLVLLAWQPVPGGLWYVGRPWSFALAAVQIVGILMTAHAARAIDVLDLAGIRQAWPLPSSGRFELTRDGLYGVVRHPIYLGWLLIVWAPPAMTGTRLVFAVVSTIYLLVAMPFEERSLREAIGPDYDRYRTDVRWKIVPFVH